VLLTVQMLMPSDSAICLWHSLGDKVKDGQLAIRQSVGCLTAVTLLSSCRGSGGVLPPLRATSSPEVAQDQQHFCRHGRQRASITRFPFR
jgi:hypothetical protein